MLLLAAQGEIGHPLREYAGHLRHAERLTRVVYQLVGDHTHRSVARPQITRDVVLRGAERCPIARLSACCRLLLVVLQRARLRLRLGKLLQGSATFTGGDDVIEARGGQVVVVPAGVAHKFVNSGAGRLRQVDIHASDHFVTEWLE
jgi:hypothetical protein